MPMRPLASAVFILAMAAIAPVSHAEFSPAGLDLQAAAESTDATPPPATAPEADAVPPAHRAQFLDKHSEWFSAGVSFADDLSGFEEMNAYFSYSHFIEDRVEVIAELSVRSFNQEGNNAQGINPAIIFRYHWWKSDEEATWTFYTDLGIGVMLSTDDVPEDGSSFNFTPRAGLGFTRALSQDTRLLIGLRWSHISNGRLWGDDDNPGSDAAMLHVGVIWQF